jgi:hypothetical protein
MHPKNMAHPHERDVPPIDVSIELTQSSTCINELLMQLFFELTKFSHSLDSLKKHMAQADELTQQALIPVLQEYQRMWDDISSHLHAFQEWV